MVLNYIWIAFFVIAFAVAIIKSFFGGDIGVWSEIMNSSFSSARTAFEISLGLTGVLSLWLGIMKIGERGGIIATFARWGEATIWGGESPAKRAVCEVALLLVLASRPAP